MVKCPICNKIFKSQFALNGHLRLKKDTENIDFYKQKNIEINKNIITFNSIKPLLKTSTKTIDVLKAFLQGWYEDQGEEIEEDRFIEKLDKIIEKERKIDLDKEKKLLRKKVYKKYKEDVRKAVEFKENRLQQDFDKKKEELSNQIKCELEDEYYSKYAIIIPCSFCHGDILALPGDKIHKKFLEIAINKMAFAHKECIQKNYPNM